jgi:hypothetical protein
MNAVNAWKMLVAAGIKPHVDMQESKTSPARLTL